MKFENFEHFEILTFRKFSLYRDLFAPQKGPIRPLTPDQPPQAAAMLPLDPRSTARSTALSGRYVTTATCRRSGVGRSFFPGEV